MPSKHIANISRSHSWVLNTPVHRRVSPNRACPQSLACRHQHAAKIVYERIGSLYLELRNKFVPFLLGFFISQDSLVVARNYNLIVAKKKIYFSALQIYLLMLDWRRFQVGFEDIGLLSAQIAVVLQFLSSNLANVGIQKDIRWNVLELNLHYSFFRLVISNYIYVDCSAVPVSVLQMIQTLSGNVARLAVVNRIKIHHSAAMLAQIELNVSLYVFRIYCKNWEIRSLKSP